MSVLINFKICDNAKECGGITVCPTGALSYDDEKESIVVDNDKCISCGRCENECPIGAIRVARTEAEFEKIKKEIEDDPRTIKDLFVDRYGSVPLSEFFTIDFNEITEKGKNSNIMLVECYNDDSIQCLLKSIPIKELTKDLPNDTLFFKASVTTEDIEKNNINELPSLLIYKNNIMIGKIDGYYENEQKEELINKINAIIK